MLPLQSNKISGHKLCSMCTYWIKRKHTIGEDQIYLSWQKDHTTNHTKKLSHKKHVVQVHLLLWKPHLGFGYCTYAGKLPPLILEDQ